MAPRGVNVNTGLVRTLLSSLAIYGLAIYGTFANWTVTLLAARRGAGRSMPIAAEERVGAAVQA